MRYNPFHSSRTPKHTSTHKTRPYFCKPANRYRLIRTHQHQHTDFLPAFSHPDKNTLVHLESVCTRNCTPTYHNYTRSSCKSPTHRHHCHSPSDYHKTFLWANSQGRSRIWPRSTDTWFPCGIGWGPRRSCRRREWRTYHNLGLRRTPNPMVGTFVSGHIGIVLDGRYDSGIRTVHRCRRRSPVGRRNANGKECTDRRGIGSGRFRMLCLETKRKKIDVIYIFLYNQE